MSLLITMLLITMLLALAQRSLPAVIYICVEISCPITVAWNLSSVTRKMF